MDRKLRLIRERLDNWRIECPTQLRCDPDNLPQICPVPHILAQKSEKKDSLQRKAYILT
jgi:hypothetical protein